MLVALRVDAAAAFPQWRDRQVRAEHEDAGACGSAECLVPGRGKHVDAELGHVDLDRSRALRRIKDEHRSRFVRDRGDVPDRRHAARDVGHVLRDHVVDPLAAQMAEMIEIDAAACARPALRDGCARHGQRA
jgi:hypothetical protein